MSASPDSNETQEAIGRFTEALRQRLGDDRFRLWFTQGVQWSIGEVKGSSSTERAVVRVVCDADFQAARIGKTFASELRAAAIIALGDGATYQIEVDSIGNAAVSPGDVQRDQPIAPATFAPTDGELPGPCGTGRNPVAGSRPQRRGGAQSLASLLSHSGSKSGGAATEPPRPNALSGGAMKKPNVFAELRPIHATAPTSDSSVTSVDASPIGIRTMDSFLTGPCNEFAFSAAMMAIGSPQIASPLFLHGPTGSGKSHLLAALADAFRSRRRMRRVILLTAEQFTNDFIASVGTTGLPAFRSRYREVDALLIDDVQFLATKAATLREALYTVETLAAAGKPLVFTANLPPNDIRGLTGEVAGRMTAGLVCPLLELDPATRLAMLRRATSLRCVLECDEGLLAEIAAMLPGDARAVHGLANLIGMLQRMHRREPTLEEVRHYAGDALRCQKVTPTLRSIERAVCEAFGLDSDGLRGKAQTRRVTEPRTLAMYLARQHTGSAFTEIAQHFGRRSHSGAIAAQAKVLGWIESNKPIGGGQNAMAAGDAIARIEAKLRTTG